MDNKVYGYGVTLPDPVTLDPMVYGGWYVPSGDARIKPAFYALMAVHDVMSWVRQDWRIHQAADPLIDTDHSTAARLDSVSSWQTNDW